MKKWVVEDWKFELTAIDERAECCRLGIEKGDKFVFYMNARQVFALE